MLGLICHLMGIVAGRTMDWFLPCQMTEAEMVVARIMQGAKLTSIRPRGVKKE